MLSEEGTSLVFKYYLFILICLVLVFSFGVFHVYFFSFFFTRSQTTKGIWIARCVGIDPCTIVMDLEGTDGRERGEVR